MTDNDNTLQGNIDREIQQLTKVFPQIFKLKSEGNLSCAKLDYDTAITLYTQAMVIIKNSEDQIKDKYADVLDKYEDFKVLLHSFNKENVALHSNLALCYAKKGMFEKSIEYDKKIVTGLDQQFDKSYARLVQNFVQLENIDSAMYNYLVLKNRFEQPTIDKYNDIFAKLQSSNQKFKDAIESSLKFNAEAKKTKTKNNQNQNQNESKTKRIISKIGDIVGSTKFTYAIGLLALSLGYYWYMSQKKIAEEVF